MVTGFGLRPFTRTHDGILIHLTGIEEWPTDVPLPKEATLLVTGNEMFRPYWRLVLGLQQTIEVVIGWFTSPRSLSDIADWYQPTLENAGWLLNTTDSKMTCVVPSR